jgi:hypothetical protein
MKRRKRHVRFRRWMLNGCPGNITRGCKRYIVRGVNAGLSVTATTNGTHAATSYHRPIFGPRRNKGKAVDMAAPMDAHGIALMRHFQRREEERRHLRYLELLGPINSRFVKNGRRYTIAEHNPLEDQHDNHVHGAPRW